MFTTVNIHTNFCCFDDDTIPINSLYRVKGGKRKRKKPKKINKRNKKSIDEKGVRTLFIRMQIVCNDFMKKKMTTAKEELQKILFMVGE